MMIIATISDALMGIATISDAMLFAVHAREESCEEGESRDLVQKGGFQPINPFEDDSENFHASKNVFSCAGAARYLRSLQLCVQEY